MTDKELRHISRKDLLEMLIDQTKEITELREKVQTLENQLSDRKVTIADSGTMAEAVLRLNGLLTDADSAAEQYLANAKQNEEKSLQLLEAANKEAKRIISEAKAFEAKKTEEGNQYIKNLKVAISYYLAKHPELKLKFEQDNLNFKL